MFFLKLDFELKLGSKIVLIENHGLKYPENSLPGFGAWGYVFMNHEFATRVIKY